MKNLTSPAAQAPPFVWRRRVLFGSFLQRDLTDRLKRQHATWLGFFIALLTACAGPYELPCHVEPSRVISGSAAYGWLAVHADGRISRLELQTRPGAFFPDLAQVSWYSAEGTAVDAFEVKVPVVPSAFDLLVDSRLAAFKDGVASVRSGGGTDGGSPSLSVDLQYRDGGTRTVEVPIGTCEGCARPYAALYQAGEHVQVVYGTPGASAKRGLVSMTFDGQIVGQTTLGFNQPIVASADALAIFPGPQLLSEALAPISTPPDPPTEFAQAAWDLSSRRIVTAGTLPERDVLLDQFDLEGKRENTLRISSADFVVNLAATSSGVGVIFSTSVGSDSLETSAPKQWFAFVDAQGNKRGPDLALEFEGFTGVGFGGLPSQLFLGFGEARFARFSPSASGLTYQEIRCE